MNDKTKLYVFEKKEVGLIFIFMILISSTSFIFGIKIGKNYSFKEAGHTVEDSKKVDLLSTDEEHVESMIKDKSTESRPMDPEAMKDLAFQKLKEKIDNEFSEKASDKKLSEDPNPVKSLKAADGEEQKSEVETKVSEQKLQVAENKKNEIGRDQYSGKFTIQLGSHRSMDEAEKFADGFRIRGYNPIINEVKIKERGVWYRVSIGIFDSISTAKDYIIKEKSLFQDLDYVIGKFD